MLMIKRIVCILLCAVAVLLCSCDSDTTAHLNDAFLTDEYKNSNRTAFHNAGCTHNIRYCAAESIDKNYSDSEYHYVYCVYDNCDFEGHFEKHSDTLILYNWVKMGRVMSNGIKYHELYFQCSVCNLYYGSSYEPITIYVACQKQGEECEGVNDCLGWTLNMEFSREELMRR